MSCFLPFFSIQGAHHMPKVGCVFLTFQNTAFYCFTTQLVKKLHQQSKYEVIEAILLFVFNTKRSLMYSWLTRYQQNSFENSTNISKNFKIQHNRPYIYGHIQTYLDLYVPILTNLNLFGIICTYMDLLRPICTFLDLLRLIWTHLQLNGSTVVAKKKRSIFCKYLNNRRWSLYEI